MLVMDGLAATRAIRVMPEGAGGCPSSPSPANAFDDDRQRCFDARVNYLAKPVPPVTLLGTVVCWLRAAKAAGADGCRPPVDPAHSSPVIDRLPYSRAPGRPPHMKLEQFPSPTGWAYRQRP